MAVLYAILIIYGALILGWVARFKVLEHRAAKSDQRVDVVTRTSAHLNETSQPPAGEDREVEREGARASVFAASVTRVAEAVREVRSALLAANESWQAWIDWLDERPSARASNNRTDVRATLHSEMWGQDPKAVNAEISRLIESRFPFEPIPVQGAGPHFALSPRRRIALAPNAQVRFDGNIGRTRQQLPVVRQAAADLATHLNPNAQPELTRTLAEYSAAIAEETGSIAWGTVFGLGVRLENAAAAARRQIENRIQPPLEDAAQAALDTVLSLHGPMILSTAEGRELSDDADSFNLTRDQQMELREVGQAIADALKNSPGIIERRALSIAEDATEAIGEGPHPERGTAYWLATVKNISTIMLPAGTLSALGWWMGGLDGSAVAAVGALMLKDNERIRAASQALGSHYDRLVDRAINIVEEQTEQARAQAIANLHRLTPFRDFITENEEPLRRIARISINFRWMVWYINFVVNTKPTRK